MSDLLRALVRRFNKLKESLCDDDNNGPMLILCLREEETKEASLARHGITPGRHQLVILEQDFSGHGNCEHCRQVGEEPGLPGRYVERR